jgi:hypothetical protein
MHRVLALGISWLCLAGLGVGAAGCTATIDPLGRQDALAVAHKRYTEFVRWGELEKAGSFVDPELREAFLDLAPAYESLRITDFEVGDIVFDEKDAATVTVNYKGYLEATLIERSAREEQEWYRDEGLKNVWHVRPQLAEVLDALRGRPPKTAGN